MIDRRRRSYRDIEHRMLANPDQARAGGVAADVGRNSQLAACQVALSL